MNDWKRILVLLLLLTGVSGCGGSESGTRRGIGVGNLAPDFTLESLDGDKVSLSDYRGSVVLVNFWASWCEPCRTEIPDLEAAYQEHKGQGLVVLGVNVAETRQVVGPSVKAFGISYPVLLDEQDRLMKVYRGLGLPMSLLIDREGVIRERHMGLLTADDLKKYLTKVLSKP